jgi:hypothetical protein
VDYDRAHADERRLGKLALHFVQSGSLRG